MGVMDCWMVWQPATDEQGENEAYPAATPLTPLDGLMVCFLSPFSVLHGVKWDK